VLALLRLIHSVVSESFPRRFEAFVRLKAPATRKEYQHVIERIRREIGPVESVTEQMAMEYAAARRQTIADSSLKQEIRLLHCIWAKCLPRKTNVWTDVLDSLPRYCPEIRPTRPVNYRVVAEYLGAPADGKVGARNKAIIGVAFVCALRRSELRALNLASVHLTECGTMYLELPHTKSGATERVPVSEPARKLLESLLLLRASQGASPDDALFVNYFFESKRQYSRLSYESIGKIFKRELGIAPHQARATAICKLRSEGVDVDDVRRFARLRSAQMVLLYDRREIALEKIQNPRF